MNLTVEVPRFDVAADPVIGHHERQPEVRSRFEPTNVSDGILRTIGQTPMVRLRRYLDDPSIELFVKLESNNPGGSAKDRPAIAMIEAAMRTGRIDSQTVIVESSSGNMGIGLAQACRYHNLAFECVVDPNAQTHNIDLMRALGARIHRVTQPVDGTYLNARLKRVAELLNQHTNVFWPNQYANLENPLSHTHGTIAEIDAVMGGSMDHLFVATSSTGTIGGCKDYLDEHRPDVVIHAIDAHGSVLFGGEAASRHIPGLGAGRVPELAAGHHFDNVQRVNDLDCVIGCRRAARREAFLPGGSGGGVLEAIRRQSDQLAGQTVVAILHDGGDRYLSTIYNDDWVTETLGIEAMQTLRRNGLASSTVDTSK